MKYVSDTGVIQGIWNNHGSHLFASYWGRRNYSNKRQQEQPHDKRARGVCPHAVEMFFIARKHEIWFLWHAHGLLEKCWPKKKTCRYCGNRMFQQQNKAASNTALARVHKLESNAQEARLVSEPHELKRHKLLHSSLTLNLFANTCTGMGFAHKTAVPRQFCSVFSTVFIAFLPPFAVITPLLSKKPQKTKPTMAHRVYSWEFTTTDNPDKIVQGNMTSRAGASGDHAGHARTAFMSHPTEQETKTTMGEEKTKRTHPISTTLKRARVVQKTCGSSQTPKQLRSAWH